MLKADNMKKSVPLAMLFQLLALILSSLIDFALWIHGIYCIAAPAVIWIIVLIVGAVFFPKEAVKIWVVYSFFLTVLTCMLPKLEFAYDVSQEAQAYRLQDLLLDREFETKLSSEKPAADEEFTDIIFESFLNTIYLSKTNQKSSREYYRDRRYEFMFIPIFYIFMLILIGIVRIHSKKEQKPSDDW